MSFVFFPSCPLHALHCSCISCILSQIKLNPLLRFKVDDDDYDESAIKVVDEAEAHLRAENCIKSFSFSFRYSLPGKLPPYLLDFILNILPLGGESLRERVKLALE